MLQLAFSPGPAERVGLRAALLKGVIPGEDQVVRLHQEEEAFEEARAALHLALLRMEAETQALRKVLQSPHDTECGTGEERR